MTFKRIRIQNFKAIEDAEIVYTAGLYNVLGINLDGPYASNGSAKTTALEAIVQCLYNRTILLAPIEFSSRKRIGDGKDLPYVIELDFECDSHTYTVINDRVRMKITIIEDGKDLEIKSITAALRKIQDILGMDVNTFITLTFITQTTITDLLDNFTSSSLMKIILDFDKITEADKSLKDKLKKLSTKEAHLTKLISSIKESLEVLGKYKSISLTPYYSRRTKLLNMLGKLVDEKKELDDTLNVYSKTVSIRDTVAKRLSDIKTNNTCECCGQSIKQDVEHKEKLKQRVAELGEELSKIDEKQIKESIEKIDVELTASRKALTKVDNDIIIVDTRNQIYEENKQKSDELQVQLADSVKELDDIHTQQDIITTAVNRIRKGTMHKHLLNAFTKTLNNHVNAFRGFVNLPYIGIKAVPKKSNIEFLIYDSRFGTEIPLHTLSGGEKTRLRLVLLLAMLNTIKDLTSASTNILVFDEALDTLDISAAPDLANLFSYMIAHDNKFIAMISHGEQLKDIDFDGDIIITKKDGVASLEVSLKGE